MNTWKQGLMIATGKYIQYPVINHHGKETLKNMYMWITESFFCTVEIDATL